MRFKFSILHNLDIVFSIVIIAAILTWIIPGGKYDRHTVNVNGVDRSVIVNGSFHYVESQPQTWQIFSAFYKGFINMSHIIVFILMVGGAFWIMNETKSIDVGIFAFLGFTRRMERHRAIRLLGVNNIIISLVMILFSLFGAIFGMSEETIAFAVIFVPLAISMGYDSLVGVSLCYFAAHIGFTDMIAPTSGVLMGVLGMARIPYAKWLKWIMPILIVLVIIGFLLLIPTVTMKLNGF